MVKTRKAQIKKSGKKGILTFARTLLCTIIVVVKMVRFPHELT